MRAKRSNPCMLQESKSGLLRFARNDVARIPTCDSAFSRRDAPELCKNPSPQNQRAQGKPGARCTRSRACSVESTRVSHHRFTGTPGLPCAMVLTAYFALSPVTGLFCHRRRRNFFHQLDASVGASGPHDFAVRSQALSSVAPSASIASRPNVRDDRDTPLCEGGMTMDVEVIWVRSEQEYFCERGWTCNSMICPSGKRLRLIGTPLRMSRSSRSNHTTKTAERCSGKRTRRVYLVNVWPLRYDRQPADLKTSPVTGLVGLSPKRPDPANKGRYKQGISVGRQRRRCR